METEARDGGVARLKANVIGPWGLAAHGLSSFFAALTFTGVNAANFLYFRRVLPGHFRVGRNLLVPLWGIGVSPYLLYAAFFSALWSAPFRTGRSIVIAGLALFALELGAAIWLRLFRRERVSASPLGLEAERGS